MFAYMCMCLYRSNVFMLNFWLGNYLQTTCVCKGSSVLCPVSFMGGSFVVPERDTHLPHTRYCCLSLLVPKF